VPLTSCYLAGKVLDEEKQVVAQDDDCTIQHMICLVRTTLSTLTETASLFIAAAVLLLQNHRNLRGGGRGWGEFLID